jgi:uncharacterized Zn-binding protein involved in type VI secretion
MGQPAARQGDLVTASDTHLVSVGGAPPTSVVLPFQAPLTDGLSPDVRIGGLPAAVLGSGGTNSPPHVPGPGLFTRPPTNRATVQTASTPVRINNRFAARNGDTALTCNDPVDMPIGTVVAGGTVSIG